MPSGADVEGYCIAACMHACICMSSCWACMLTLPGTRRRCEAPQPPAAAHLALNCLQLLACIRRRGRGGRRAGAGGQQRGRFALGERGWQTRRQAPRQSSLRLRLPFCSVCSNPHRDWPLVPTITTSHQPPATNAIPAQRSPATHLCLPAGRPAGRACSAAGCCSGSAPYTCSTAGPAGGSPVRT